MSNFSFEPLKLQLATNNIIIPMENGVADLTNAETSAKIMLAGKELFPIFDERIGGRNYLYDIQIYPSYFDKVDANTFKSKVKLNHWTAFIQQLGKYDLIDGEQYVLSFKIKSKDGVAQFNHANLYIYGANKVYYHNRPTITTEYNSVITPIVWDSRNTYCTLYIQNVTDEEVVFIKDIKLEKGNKATDWTPAPEEVLQNATLSFYNCSAAIVGDLIKITSHKPDTTRGWVDVTVNYGNLSNTKRLNWSVEGVEVYKPTGTLLTMNNRGIKL